MALIRQPKLFKNTASKFVAVSASLRTGTKSSDGLFEQLEKVRKEDMPVEMENPFVKERPQCILCKYDIEVDFKNPRLLSQFVSKFTGKLYGRHITGLCEYQQTKVEKEIKKSRMSGLMPSMVKNPNYLADPDLYDPNNPLKPHKY